MAAAMLGMLALPGLQRMWVPKQEVRYVRTPRRWLGLRGGRLVAVAQPQQQQWQALPQGEAILRPCACFKRLRSCMHS
jgi:hypothetical protein